MWNLASPPGFQGLREDKPLTVYQRHLPHWRQEGATYFVTCVFDVFFTLHAGIHTPKCVCERGGVCI